MHRFTFAFSPLLVAAIVAVSSSARATAEFPAEINTDLGAMSDAGAACGPPDCVLCHLSDNGGLGTVQHPFGLAMRARGLSAFNDQGLAAALQKMETDIDPNTCMPGIDSNCDGLVDTDQLKACDWQSIVTNNCGAGDGGASACAGSSSTENVLYGCAVTSDHRHTDATPFVIAGMFGVGLFVKRRKR